MLKCEDQGSAASQPLISSSSPLAASAAVSFVSQQLQNMTVASPDAGPLSPSKEVPHVPVAIDAVDAGSNPLLIEIVISDCISQAKTMNLSVQHMLLLLLPKCVVLLPV